MCHLLQLSSCLYCCVVFFFPVNPFWDVFIPSSFPLCPYLLDSICCAVSCWWGQAVNQVTRMIHIKNKPTVKSLESTLSAFYFNVLQSITAIILSHLLLVFSLEIMHLQLDQNLSILKAATSATHLSCSHLQFISCTL